MKRKKEAEMRPTDEWPWKLKRKDERSRLLEEWARLGYRLPDPRRQEDFALHLRLLEVAFGMADLQSPIGEGPSLLPHQPSIHKVVRQLAEATWQRLQVFCRPAEKEAAQLRETLEKAEAGTLPRPKTLREYVKAIRDWHRVRERNETSEEASASDTAPAPDEGMAAGQETGRVPYVETPGEPASKWVGGAFDLGVHLRRIPLAFKEAEALNRRVDEAFRRLEGAVQKALEGTEPAYITNRQSIRFKTGM